ncbi:MAG: peptide chain release factor N(5)-glutamine methyltransferase [Nannocystaceae bacterium]|nr:peptide chain release factor N(5)-glutamine methyltransferase [Nannocystaceae bacterium]
MPQQPPPAPGTPSTPRGPNAGPPGGARSQWTIGELLDWTQARLFELGVEQPRLDAERLLAHALDCNRLTLYTERDRLVEESARARFRELVRRRLGREPVAYIEGRRGFHALGLELLVDPRVLVPRPETEHLVDWILEDVPASAELEVLDVGTGSGAIALALKHARSGFSVRACDVSADALAVAANNGERLRLSVTWLQSDLLQQVTPPAGGFAVVAANLPYIASDALAELPPEVKHEPRLALDGGPDGLRVIAALLRQLQAPGVLAPEASVYLEVGFDQASAVAAMLDAAGLQSSIRNDYAGIGRIVRGRRGAPPPA